VMHGEIFFLCYLHQLQHPFVILLKIQRSTAFREPPRQFVCD